MNMYVSNLGFQVTDEELKALFAKYGVVTSAKVITDRETGKSRGFAFVEMDDKAAETAMKELDGSRLDDRSISVSKAKPKSESRNGSFSRDRGNRW
jgi:RNA recognition motif-containing protein